MAQTKEIALALAAFLDSAEARALATPRVADIRELAEMFLGVCYEDLGKKPRLLEGEDMSAALERLMPARMAKNDRRAEHVRDVLDAYLAHLEATQVVTQAYEIRRALDATIDGFLEAVRAGSMAHQRAPSRQEPVVHRAEKLGRNDPCFCGSGRKFKKCHGKST